MRSSQPMTLNSSSINKTFFLLSTFTLLCCKDSETTKLAATKPYSNSVATDTLYKRCSAKSCSLFTLTMEGKDLYIAEGSMATTVRKLKSNLYSARSSCGSPCSATLYYDSEHRRKGGFFSDVIAVDTVNLLVAHMEDSSVTVECIFSCGKKPLIFHPALGPAAAPVSAIKNARFEQNRLIVEYLKGEDFAPATDTFTIANWLKSP